MRRGNSGPDNKGSDNIEDMSGRGRGSGARGGLKGATWEIDHEVKLDSQPSDTFPVRPALLPLYHTLATADLLSTRNTLTLRSLAHSPRKRNVLSEIIKQFKILFTVALNIPNPPSATQMPQRKPSAKPKSIVNMADVERLTSTPSLLSRPIL